MDLNLLNVFEALFELRSVTRTAARLNLTQSAVSHALRRLRETLDDPLFVRAPGGLQPTARAEEIAPGVTEGLTQLRSALAPTVFDPATATRTFTVAAGSYFSALVIPGLLAHGRREAPGVAFRIVQVNAGLLAEFDESVVDLALGAFTTVPARLTSEPLFQEDLVWIASVRNPIARTMPDPQTLARHPRLNIQVIRPFEMARALMDDNALEARTVAEAALAVSPVLQDEPSATVYDAVTATAIVGATDLVALVPRRIAALGAARGEVALLDAPTGGTRIDLSMLWHAKFEADAGLRWLRQTLHAIVA